MRAARATVVAAFLTLVFAAPAAATPVCTDGYKGGPPADLCGGRIFPEAELARGYIQYTPDPFGFIEYQHGIEYLAQKYPRWISVFKLSDLYGEDAVSAGPDALRSYEEGDAADGRDIQVTKISDHNVPDEGKETLLFSLSVHGNERGGLEGGVRTAEDLAIAAEQGGTIVDGYRNYESSTGRHATLHEHDVADVLAKEAVYLLDFNADGWAVGDWWNQPPLPYSRGNSIGTDLNRQMPTIGRVNENRNPLQESEMKYGTEFMHKVASLGQDGKMAYGADIHGEANSQAYMDIMYPAGEFDSVDHRRLMAIAERTKSVIDETLYEGIVEESENATGGNDSEYPKVVPLKPAHWATVWDTLGYTDTGFIGDYMATDLGVTGMDYEIFLNHSVPDKTWNVYLQENHINASRGIIKTAMAYTLFQEDEFNASNVRVDTGGRAGYVVNPDTVTDKDEDGPGRLPGPEGDGIGENGEPVEQRSYEVTNQKWFADTNAMMDHPFRKLRAADIASNSRALNVVDTLVLADVPAPADSRGRTYDKSAYFANIRAWVERGGNLVLTDKALHALGDLGVVAADAVTDIAVYQPYANFQALDHAMTKGLRPNAHQLVEAATLGYGIGSDESPMTVVDTAAWEAAGGHVVGTTTTLLTGEDPAIDRNLDDGATTSVGELLLGDAGGRIRIVGGTLPTPTETQDHRFGLRNYALTYSGLFLMENSVRHDVAKLGVSPKKEARSKKKGSRKNRKNGRKRKR
ncbi:MAG: M14 family zinc carboxypeptidase [Thermoleophilaceae bacterium]